MLHLYVYSLGQSNVKFALNYKNQGIIASTLRDCHLRNIVIHRDFQVKSANIPFYATDIFSFLLLLA